MMNRIVFGCRSNSGGQTWPSHDRSSAATGSLRTFSGGQILSDDIMIAHRTAREPSRRFRALTASASPEIQPAFNTH